MLVGDKFGNCDCEGDLDSTSETGERVGANETIHFGRRCADDCSNERKAVADDEEPASAEDVGEATDEEEADRESQGVGERDPAEIG